VRRAERQLAAATARIGVATADLFPRFTLTGLLGLQGTTLSDLATADSRFWTFGPAVRWPLFDAGGIRAGIAVQNARQEQALVVYEDTVLKALEESENAMVAYAKGRATHEALVRAAEATRQSADIARELYRRGLVDFLNVLQSESALYTVEDRLVQGQQSVSTQLVALFKALGGGWQVPAAGAGQAQVDESSK
jgi:multidrug efflux system outer membrane protein